MKTIMLVDDVEISNFIMKKLISNVSSDNAIYEFSDPSVAVSAISEIKPDVIFLDINMPVIDGWEFLEIMKERNESYSVYILTSSTSELDRRRSSAYTNVVSFLTKPVDREKLAEILEALPARISPSAL